MNTVGKDIDRHTFTREDRTRYREKVRRCLEVFARMLRESRFDFERPQTGLDIELNLVDAGAEPVLRNAEVLGAIVSAYVDSRSLPVIEMCRSSPRAAKICSLSSA